MKGWATKELSLLRNVGKMVYMEQLLLTRFLDNGQKVIKIFIE